MKIDLSRIPVSKGANTRLGWKKYNISYENLGLLQLTFHVVQNRHAGEQMSHWDTGTKEITIYNYVCPYLSCPTATFCSPALRFCTT